MNSVLSYPSRFYSLFRCVIQRSIFARVQIKSQSRDDKENPHEVLFLFFIYLLLRESQKKLTNHHQVHYEIGYQGDFVPLRTNNLNLFMY